jgi:hypothetical protein
MPAWVTVFAVHFMTAPSFGQHIMHSTFKSNRMFPAENVPMEYERKTQEPGLTNPSAMHLPSMSLDTACNK